MISDNPCKLTVRAIGIMSDFAHLTVCNGFFEDIAKGYECLEVWLPQGIYGITLKLDGHVIKENIRLEGDTYHEFKTPPIYSSLVAEKFESSREYYTSNAVRYSKEPTVNSGISDGGSIFLFFRYTDFVSSQELNKERRPLGDGFSLLDGSRKVLYRLLGNNIKEDLYNGWMAFNAVLSEGLYYLHYSGRSPNPAWENDQGLPAREIPLQVFKSKNSWQTQVFLTFGKGPIFPSMSIFIAPAEQGFNNNDESNYKIDGVRHKFHNGVYYVPEKVLREFEQGQWTSPMKGLLAAYVYFNSPENTYDNLFRNILKDLPAILGEETPDIKALQVLAAQYFKEPLPAVKISEPGMFLAGAKATIKASIKQPDIIPDDSPMENIADNLYCDMVWTSYLPDPLPLAEITTANIADVIERIIGSETSPEEIGKKLLNSRTVSTLLYYIDKLDNDTDINDLAGRLQIPPNVVRKTISHILSFSDSIKDIQQFNISKLKNLQ
ncbi:hypothetical protein SAMN05518672_114108 [Chitinophaga sp. CF118]|uniref:hypothetical protein n=1 Tax=Chitinophaga sp. CF118 TaxID=1884367 RepID=UPI0008EFB530|nr:hypothetical protein [Chitinophaga sp. CF118]SFF02694.1 hypothetical protein SAMN05518672_114108 [Chitinophaga sp. CF118]